MIVFRVTDEVFATDIAVTREVIRLDAITPVPGAPEAVAGITSVRGRIVPLLELGILFHIGSHTSLEAYILLLDLPDSEPVGMIVDEILEIRHFSVEEITTAPKILSSKVSPDFIAGVILPKAEADKEQVILLVDLAATITKSTAEMLGHIKSTPAAAKILEEET
jgi:purine-binding chemotaxis protein CheW